MPWPVPRAAHPPTLVALVLVGVLLQVTLTVPTLWARSGDDPEVTDLDVAREGDQVLVSFRMDGAFDDELIERIQSGLPTGFTYQVRLEKARKWWLNPSPHKSEIQMIAMYNAITRDYLINTKQDGRLISSTIVTSLDELRQHMTILDGVPFVQLDHELKGRHWIKVRAELGSKTILLLFPTRRHTAWAETPFRQAPSSPAPAIATAPDAWQ